MDEMWWIWSKITWNVDWWPSFYCKIGGIWLICIFLHFHYINLTILPFLDFLRKKRQKLKVVQISWNFYQVLRVILGTISQNFRRFQFDLAKLWTKLKKNFTTVSVVNIYFSFNIFVIAKTNKSDSDLLFSQYFSKILIKITFFGHATLLLNTII